MNLRLYITLEPANGRPVTVARVTDRRMLINAAEAVIVEACRQAELMSQEDEVLGTLQREEVARLRRSLKFLLPDLNVDVESDISAPQGPVM